MDGDIGGNIWCDAKGHSGAPFLQILRGDIYLQRGPAAGVGQGDQRQILYAGNTGKDLDVLDHQKLIAW